MSKVVSPYEPFTGVVEPLPGASWWRFELVPNDAGQLTLMETDGSVEASVEPTWCSWEFFDGFDSVIDAGFDRPTKVILRYLAGGGHIDVLGEGPPTPSDQWVRLTRVGDPIHPDDL